MGGISQADWHSSEIPWGGNYTHFNFHLLKNEKEELDVIKML